MPIQAARWPKTMRQGVRQCLNWINEDRPNIYLPNSALPAYFAGTHAQHNGLQTIGILHSDDSFFSAVTDEFIAGDPARRFSSVVAVSQFLADRVQALKIPNLACHRIPCGVPIPEKTASPSGDRFRLVYVGRLVEEQKQVSEMTRAFCEAAARNPKLEAVIAGEGPARSSVEQIISQAGKGNRVRLAGRLSTKEIYELLQTSHAFVLLSDYEGLPISLLEAMACGVVPVCLKMRSGIGEVLQTDFNGIIVENRQESFQQAVSQLVAKPAFWRKCSLNARATVEGEFSREACHQKWFSLLSNFPEAARKMNFPVRMPARLPQPNPKFNWYEPDALDRMLPFATPLRNRVGRWRRRIFPERNWAFETDRQAR